MAFASTVGTLLQVGEVYKNRFKVLGNIAKGRYNEIYKGVDLTTKDAVILKVESSDKQKKKLKTEAWITKKLEDCRHVCRLLYAGRSPRYSVVGLTMQGKNLADLRREQPNGCFSLSTTLQLATQMLYAIEYMHTEGVVHRNISPSHFLIGLPPNHRTVYIIDFSSARQFKKPDGEIKEPRKYTEFKGNARYSSPNAHLNKELGRGDDLVSLVYVMSEMAAGRLPWPEGADRNEVAAAKTKTPPRALLSKTLQPMADHVMTLEYYDIPDYALLHSTLSTCLSQCGALESDAFDWETQVTFPSLPQSLDGVTETPVAYRCGQGVQTNLGDSVCVYTPANELLATQPVLEQGTPFGCVIFRPGSLKPAQHHPAVQFAYITQDGRCLGLSHLVKITQPNHPRVPGETEQDDGLLQCSSDEEDDGSWSLASAKNSDRSQVKSSTSDLSLSLSDIVVLSRCPSEPPTPTPAPAPTLPPLIFADVAKGFPARSSPDYCMVDSLPSSSAESFVVAKMPAENSQMPQDLSQMVLDLSKKSLDSTKAETAARVEEDEVCSFFVRRDSLDELGIKKEEAFDVSSTRISKKKLKKLRARARQRDTRTTTHEDSSIVEEMKEKSPPLTINETSYEKSNKTCKIETLINDENVESVDDAKPDKTERIGVHHGSKAKKHVKCQKDNEIKPYADSDNFKKTQHKSSNKIKNITLSADPVTSYDIIKITQERLKGVPREKPDRKHDTRDYSTMNEQEESKQLKNLAKNDENETVKQLDKAMQIKIRSNALDSNSVINPKEANTIYRKKNEEKKAEFTKRNDHSLSNDEKQEVMQRAKYSNKTKSKDKTPPMLDETVPSPKKKSKIDDLTVDYSITNGNTKSNVMTNKQNDYSINEEENTIPALPGDEMRKVCRKYATTSNKQKRSNRKSKGTVCFDDVSLLYRDTHPKCSGQGQTTDSDTGESTIGAQSTQAASVALADIVDGPSVPHFPESITTTDVVTMLAAMPEALDVTEARRLLPMLSAGGPRGAGKCRSKRAYLRHLRRHVRATCHLPLTPPLLQHMLGQARRADKDASSEEDTCDLDQPTKRFDVPARKILATVRSKRHLAKHSEVASRKKALDAARRNKMTQQMASVLPEASTSGCSKSKRSFDEAGKEKLPIKKPLLESDHLKKNADAEERRTFISRPWPQPKPASGFDFSQALKAVDLRARACMEMFHFTARHPGGESLQWPWPDVLSAPPRAGPSRQGSVLIEELPWEGDRKAAEGCHTRAQKEDEEDLFALMAELCTDEDAHIQEIVQHDKDVSSQNERKMSRDQPMTSSGVTSSGMTSSGVTSSGMTSSGVTSSGVASSGVTSSGVTSSGVTSSKVTLSGVTSSGVRSSRETSHDEAKKLRKRLRQHGSELNTIDARLMEIRRTLKKEKRLTEKLLSKVKALKVRNDTDTTAIQKIESIGAINGKELSSYGEEQKNSKVPKQINLSRTPIHAINTTGLNNNILDLYTDQQVFSTGVNILNNYDPFSFINNVIEENATSAEVAEAKQTNSYLDFIAPEDLSHKKHTKATKPDNAICKTNSLLDKKPQSHVIDIFEDITKIIQMEEEQIGNTSQRETGSISQSETISSSLNSHIGVCAGRHVSRVSGHVMQPRGLEPTPSNRSGPHAIDETAEKSAKIYIKNITENSTKDYIKVCSESSTRDCIKVCTENATENPIEYSPKNFIENFTENSTENIKTISDNDNIHTPHNIHPLDLSKHKAPKIQPKERYEDFELSSSSKTNVDVSFQTKPTSISRYSYHSFDDIYKVADNKDDFINDIKDPTQKNTCFHPQVNDQTYNPFRLDKFGFYLSKRRLNTSPTKTDFGMNFYDIDKEKYTSTKTYKSATTTRGASHVITPPSPTYVTSSRHDESRVSQSRDNPQSNVSHSRDNPESYVSHSRDNPVSYVPLSGCNPESRVSYSSGNPESRVPESPGDLGSREGPKPSLDSKKISSKRDPLRHQSTDSFDSTSLSSISAGRSNLQQRSSFKFVDSHNRNFKQEMNNFYATPDRVVNSEAENKVQRKYVNNVNDLSLNYESPSSSKTDRFPHYKYTLNNQNISYQKNIPRYEKKNLDSGSHKSPPEDIYSYHRLIDFDYDSSFREASQNVVEPEISKDEHKVQQNKNNGIFYIGKNNKTYTSRISNDSSSFRISKSPILSPDFAEQYPNLFDLFASSVPNTASNQSIEKNEESKFKEMDTTNTSDKQSCFSLPLCLCNMCCKARLQHIWI